MRKIFELLKREISAGHDSVLVTVIASSGSTPRGSGARMLISKMGQICGTIGGGAVEYKAQKIAFRALEQKKSSFESFQLSPNQVMDLGMICGGDVSLYFQFIGGNDQEVLHLIDDILARFDSGQDTWLIAEITGGVSGGMFIGTPENGILGLDLEPDEADSLMQSQTIQVRTVSQYLHRAFYSEPIIRSGWVYVFGGGHIAQELVPVLEHLSFRCVVMDDRPEFANKKLFPRANKTIVGDFSRLGDYINLTENDYVIIMTRGHSFDYEVQLQAMRSCACYIGVIGSSRKIATINQKLINEGCSPEEIARIHTPIGLPIKAETPAEIAISVAAELIRERAERYAS